jgi:hypothetical protein
MCPTGVSLFQFENAVYKEAVFVANNGTSGKHVKRPSRPFTGGYDQPGQTSRGGDIMAHLSIWWL